MSEQQTPVYYDDELDENFEDDLAADLNVTNMKNTIQSFENPKGLDEINEISPINLDGKRIDDNAINTLLEQLKAMPRKEVKDILKKIKQEKEHDNTKNDFSSVSVDHKEDANKRLKNKLRDMRNSRKTKK